MKSLRNSTFIAVLAVIVFFSATTFAAVNSYLEIKDAEGKVTKVTIAKEGSFSSSSLAAGTYTVALVFSRGPRQTTSLDGDFSRSDVANGSAGRESSVPSVSEITISYDVKSARDQSTGMASGKRMHKPFVISLSSSERLLPTVNKKGGTIAIDEPGVQVTGRIQLKDQNGKTMAYDDWSQTR